MLERAIDRSTLQELPPSLHDAASPQSLRRTNRVYRRLLGVADMLACLVALTVCIPLLGQGNDQVPVGLLAGLPLVLVITKLLGLYDRDELVLRKSTLEEAPKLFELATLFSLVLWIGSGPLHLGLLGGDQVAGLWGVLFAGCSLGAGRRAVDRAPDHRARALPAAGRPGRLRARAGQDRGRPRERRGGGLDHVGADRRGGGAAGHDRRRSRSSTTSSG